MSRYVSAILQPAPGQGPVLPSLVATYQARPWSDVATYRNTTATAGDAVRADAKQLSQGAPAPIVISFERATFASLDELSTLAPSSLNPRAEAMVGAVRYISQFGGHWRPETRPGETP